MIFSMKPDTAEDPSSSNASPPQDKKTGTGWLGRFFKKDKTENGNSLRDALEEYVETSEDNGDEDASSAQEREILTNILKLRDIRAADVMIPRADIIAVDSQISQKDLLTLISEKQCSRLPVYSESLDHVLGTIHVKDVLACLAEDKKVDILELIKEVPIVSPATPVLDLILEMRYNRRHMAMVVDEYGGIDGLVTVGDIVEEIVGDIHDEHDLDEAEPQFKTQDDGSVIADARVEIDDFEEEYGTIATDTERDESDTLGGLVCVLAGRVPARGEVLTHDTGTIFEVLEADPRRIHSLKIRNIQPLQPAEE